MLSTTSLLLSRGGTFHALLQETVDFHRDPASGGRFMEEAQVVARAIIIAGVSIFVAVMWLSFVVILVSRDRE